MKVMVFGSFDKLHDGHRALFAQAREHGDVYVVLARDVSIQRLKKREPRMSEDARRALVAAEKDVHTSVLGNPDDFFLVVEEHKPDMLLLGYDQKTFSLDEIASQLAQRDLHPRILRARPYKKDVFKSSKLSP